MEEKPAELPISPQETQIQAPSLLDKIKIHKFKILGGILGVLVFVGAVFGAYKVGQKQVQPAPQPTPTPGLVATPTPDPTANWKTYTNEKYGYLIKYPENLEPIDKTKELSGSTGEINSIIFLGDAEISIWVSTHPWEIIKKSFAAGFVGRTLEVELAGERGLMFEGVTGPGEGGGLPVKQYLLRHKDRNYQIAYNESAVTTPVNRLETFNLMLSTFRFLE